MKRGGIRRRTGLRSTATRRTRPDRGVPMDANYQRWQTNRASAMSRDGFTCRRCGQPASEVHHRVLKGMGGMSDDPDRDRLDRLVSLCAGCHRWAHSERTAAETDGYVISREHRAHAPGIPILCWSPILGPHWLIFDPFGGTQTTGLPRSGVVGSYDQERDPT